MIFTKTNIKSFDTKITLKRFFQYFKDCKLFIFFVFLLCMLSAAGHVIALYFTGQSYDKYLMEEKIWTDEVFFGFCFVIFGMFFSYIWEDVTIYIVSLLMVIISEKKICFSLRRDIFNKLQTFPIRYFDTNPSGELITRTSNDVDNVGIAISQYVANDIYWFFISLGVLVIMFLINVPLTFITIIIYPFMIWFTSKIMKKIKPYFQLQQEEIGKMTSFIEERISGTKIVSLFEKEKLNENEYKNINKRLTKNSIVANATTNMLQPTIMFFNNIAFVILASLGISLVVANKIDINSGLLHYNNKSSLLIIFTIFTRNLTNPINQIISSSYNIMLALTSLGRIFEIFKQESEIDENDAIILPKKIKGKIEAKNLFFSYEKNKTILTNINFVANPNNITAIVGPTGSGKTTIINLITRFYEIDKGNLFIDGIPINKIKRSSLRENIAMVTQDTFLFNTTIRENIRIGRLDATNNEIEEAAKLSNSYKFINKLPNGFETIINDNGNNLSQGQRQMLSIARAFLSKSKIIILDEATSNIDTKTELDIQKAFELLSKNRTTIIIAHRLSTIRNANNILVIKNGEIIESGNHKDLINKKGFYYNLYNSQFKKGEQI